MASAHQAATTTTSNTARDSATSREHLQALVESDHQQISDFLAGDVFNYEELGEVWANLHRVIELGRVAAQSRRDGGNATKGLNARGGHLTHAPVPDHPTELDNLISNVTTPYDSAVGSNTALSAEDTTLSSLLCNICKRPGKPVSGPKSRKAKLTQLTTHRDRWAPGSNKWYMSSVQRAFKKCNLAFDKEKNTPVDFLLALLAAMDNNWKGLPIHICLAIQALLNDDQCHLRSLVAAYGIDANYLTLVDHPEAANSMYQLAIDRELECRCVILHCLEHYRLSKVLKSGRQRHDEQPVVASTQHAAREYTAPLTRCPSHIAGPFLGIENQIQGNHDTPRFNLDLDTPSKEGHADVTRSTSVPESGQRFTGTSHGPFSISPAHIAEPVLDKIHQFQGEHDAPWPDNYSDRLPSDGHTNVPMSSSISGSSQRFPRSRCSPLSIPPAQFAKPFLDTSHHPLQSNLDSSTFSRDRDEDVEMFSPVPPSGQQSPASPRIPFLTTPAQIDQSSLGTERQFPGHHSQFTLDFNMALQDGSMEDSQPDLDFDAVFEYGDLDASQFDFDIDAFTRDRMDIDMPPHGPGLGDQADSETQQGMPDSLSGRTQPILISSNGSSMASKRTS